MMEDNLGPQFREVREHMQHVMYAPFMHNTAMVQKVRLDNLIATQSMYSQTRVDEYQQGREPDQNTHADVQIYRTRNNRSYVQDGHHRVLAAKQRGDTHIDAVVKSWKGST